MMIKVKCTKKKLEHLLVLMPLPYVEMLWTLISLNLRICWRLIGMQVTNAMVNRLSCSFQKDSIIKIINLMFISSKKFIIIVLLEIAKVVCFSRLWVDIMRLSFLITLLKVSRSFWQYLRFDINNYNLIWYKLYNKTMNIIDRSIFNNSGVM